MGLSAEEQKLFDKLTKKSKEPDAPSVGRTLRANIDLGDEKQVSLARKLGFLPPEEDDDDDDDGKGKGKGKGDDDDETPKRRGYFGT